jgi:hypothetical protein
MQTHIHTQFTTSYMILLHMISHTWPSYVETCCTSVFFARYNTYLLLFLLKIDNCKHTFGQRCCKRCKQANACLCCNPICNGDNTDALLNLLLRKLYVKFKRIFSKFYLYLAKKADVQGFSAQQAMCVFM